MAATAFPNIMLRGGLFSDDPTHPALQDAEIMRTGQGSIQYSGEALDQTDQKVYAACIQLYRHRPLAANDAGCLPRLNALVEAAPLADRGRLVSAVRDTLARYPNVLYAAPVLIHIDGPADGPVELLQSQMPPPVPVR